MRTTSASPPPQAPQPSRWSRANGWGLSAAIFLIFIVLLAAGTQPVSAHPIDEIRSQALIHLESTDGARFDATVFLAQAHIQDYKKLLDQLGLPPEQDRDALALTVSHAFGFGACTATLGAPGQRHLERGGGAWVGMRYVVQCPGPQTEMTLERKQYRRDRTRTTLLWTIAVRGREEVQALVPPHMQSVTLQLSDGELLRANRGSKQQIFRDDVSGASPADPARLSDFPDQGASRSATPPWSVLLAWFEEGALHLLGGPDHLLFLLTLLLAGRSVRSLLLGVTGFSLGHMAAMAAALLAQWSAPSWLDVLIGLTIAASAWQGRSPEGLLPLRIVATSVAFGLIHGMGFGAGLQALVGGVDQIWWPLLAFGLGLDTVQVIWVLLSMALWSLALTWLQRRGRDRPQVQRLASNVLVTAGLGTALAAAVQVLSGDSPY